MEEGVARAGHGMMLGKFMPPHLGHVYLADFARAYCERLSIVVGSLESEPIPGALRHAWMRELFPDCEVIHLTQELPQEPSEHPDFWDLWREALRGVLEGPVRFVFASEPYGFRLAQELGAEYVPVDHARELVPVSGTAVREDPMGNWRYLPACVRPYFVRRVCLFGPESTGKSVLAQRLAERYGTVYAAEYARPLMDLQDNRCDPETILRIARGQRASEEALARQANRVLFCDTDALTTSVWSEALFGECPRWLWEEAVSRRYDLTLLFDVDCPWVEDGTRFFPDSRRKFFEWCKLALEAAGRPYTVIGGSWEERFEASCAAVDGMLSAAKGPAA